MLQLEKSLSMAQIETEHYILELVAQGYYKPSMCNVCSQECGRPEQECLTPIEAHSQGEIIEPY